MPMKLEELRQEASEFSVSLGYRVKPCLKKNNNTENINIFLVYKAYLN